MILRFLAGSVAFHVLYYTFKNIVVPAFSGDNTPKAVVAEIAKRLVFYIKYVTLRACIKQANIIIINVTYMNTYLMCYMLSFSF